MWMLRTAKRWWMRGLDPDDPRVVTGIDLMRWELSLLLVRMAGR